MYGGLIMNRKDRQDLYYFRNRDEILKKRREAYRVKMQDPEYREKERERLREYKRNNRESIKLKNKEI